MTGPSPANLLGQVRETAQGYDVFGELGRKADDDIWFLAREQGQEQLVALRLRKEPSQAGGEPVMSLEVAKELGPQVSMGEGDCWKCRGTLRSFARFCGRCGADQTKGTRVATSAAERKALLDEVRAAAGEHYQVLGEMIWQGGEGGVYFAVERTSGELVRLRLRPSDDGLELGETKVAMSLTNSITAAYMTQVGGPAGPPPIIHRRESGAEPAVERSSGAARAIDLPTPPGPAPGARRSSGYRPSPPPPDTPAAAPMGVSHRERILLGAVIVLGVLVIVLTVLVLAR